jgi:hypothetical protein
MSSITPDDDRSGLIFDSIIWRGDFMIEISFTEERDRGDGVCKVTTLVIDRRKLDDHYRQLIEALVEFVDEGQVVLRNPPETIRREVRENIS